MRTKYIVALSMLAGMAVGAFAVQTLHAQAKSPVYMIGLNEVTDADRYSNEYLRPAQASIKAHGGVYVAAGPGTLIEGTLPKEGVFILRWDSMEALRPGVGHRITWPPIKSELGTRSSISLRLAA